MCPPVRPPDAHCWSELPPTGSPLCRPARPGLETFRELPRVRCAAERTAPAQSGTRLLPAPRCPRLSPRLLSARMNVPLPLWVALILWCCHGNVRSENGEEEDDQQQTATFDESTVTPTPDYEYDYNATFDYYFVSSNYGLIASTEAPSVRSANDNSSCRSVTDRSLIISTLLLSLAALLR